MRRIASRTASTAKNITPMASRFAFREFGEDSFCGVEESFGHSVFGDG